MQIDFFRPTKPWLFSCILLGFLAWLILFTAGLHFYVGATTVYVAFSLVFSALLVSGIYKRRSYGYLFLVLFLWLGFWFKLTANFLLFGSFPFGEPVGYFDSSPAAWDEVLLVATCAGFGVLIGRGIYAYFGPNINSKPLAEAPPWYAASRAWLWAIALMLSSGIAVFNVVYGIHQIGITARTILPWPLNALIAWMLNLGSAIIIAVLIWWDCVSPRKITWTFFGMLGDAFLSTVSVISRSAFPFHSIPQMLALHDMKQVSGQYTTSQKIIAASLFITLCFASVTAVSFLRDHQYTASKSLPAPTPTHKNALPTIGAPAVENVIDTSSAAKPISSFRLILIHQLLVNRWIGLEGVMAVASSQKKGSEVFWAMVTEKRKAGIVTEYQSISNSGYQLGDTKYQFASLPGPAAFFLYSGSFLVVFGGMVMMTLLVIGAEQLVFLFTRNPLLCSLAGITFANTVAQFGIAPRQDIPYLSMIIFSAILIAFLQSQLFADLLPLNHTSHFSNESIDLENDGHENKKI